MKFYEILKLTSADAGALYEMFYGNLSVQAQKNIERARRMNFAQEAAESRRFGLAIERGN